ncbi:MAG: zinc ribbon domain-containing protein [Candidatus Sericytochromatia bacterium]|nr:zinc ribbon domain-containing protein [Candidatus Tanganyikabacteria bacterium]
MKCPSCGFEEDAAKYCKQCGAPMVSDKKAEYMGVPQYTGITISPPTASQGLKVEDIEEVGLHDEDPHLSSGEVMSSSSEAGNSFGIFLIMAIVVALVIFAFKMFAPQGV